MTRQTQLDLFSIITPRPRTLPDNASWRTIQTPHQTIGFILRRSRRRSIGFTVDDHGLRVTAPTLATLAQIDGAVLERSTWILEKLRLRQERLQQLASAETLWKHHGRLPYMGAMITLELDPACQLSEFDGMTDQPRNGDRLHLPLAPDADHQRIQDSVHAWLQQQALWWFRQRLQHFLDKSGQTLNSWRLSSATTRWGSCSSDRRIMLNWRLIHFKHAIIDYVIAHEVAHLREMNHSPAFWQELERLMPDFAHSRAELRHHRPGVLPLI